MPAGYREPAGSRFAFLVHSRREDTTKGGAPFVSLIHPDGHGFPAEGSKLIAKFFRENPKK